MDISFFSENKTKNVVLNKKPNKIYKRIVAVLNKKNKIHNKRIVAFLKQSKKNSWCPCKKTI
jgi:hypothetical protein